MTLSKPFLLNKLFCLCAYGESVADKKENDPSVNDLRCRRCGP